MKNRILPILFILFFILPVQAKREPDLYKKADSQRMEHWVDSVFDSMSVKERIGQLFVLAVDVNTSAKNKELIRKYVEEYKVEMCIRDSLQSELHITFRSVGRK